MTASFPDPSLAVRRRNVQHVVDVGFFLPQMELKETPMRLKEWLITQIDSGQYTGLSWENDEKTLFKIPWKHAAKQDYRQNEDAALFKVLVIVTLRMNRSDFMCFRPDFSSRSHKDTESNEKPNNLQV